MSGRRPERRKMTGMQREALVARLLPSERRRPPDREGPQGMRLFFDTEFQASGSRIEWISLGIVREDGATYYAVNGEFSGECEPWVKTNILPLVAADPIETWKPAGQVRQEVVAFAGPRPEWWGFFSDYDWVALCGLFGRLVDHPPGWPQFCLDLQQWRWQLGLPALPAADPALDGGPEHHALADARWTKRAWEYLALNYGPPRAPLYDRPGKR